MQAFMRLTQSKVLPVIFCCRGHGQSDRQRGRIKNAGGVRRERGSEGRHRVHSQFRNQRTLQTGVQSGAIKCFSGKMRSRRRWRRRTGRLVSPLLEVGGGADGRAGDTRVTCGLRHRPGVYLPQSLSRLPG